VTKYRVPGPPPPGGGGYGGGSAGEDWGVSPPPERGAGGLRCPREAYASVRRGGPGRGPPHRPYRRGGVRGGGGRRHGGGEIVRRRLDATPDIDDRAGGTWRPAGDCVYEVNRGRRESGRCGARTRSRESACRSQKNRFLFEFCESNRSATSQKVLVSACVARSARSSAC
jgi:hypothetical protein